MGPPDAPSRNASWGEVDLGGKQVFRGNVLRTPAGTATLRIDAAPGAFAASESSSRCHNAVASLESEASGNGFEHGDKKDVVSPGNSRVQAHFSASTILRVVTNSRRKTSQTPGV